MALSTTKRRLEFAARRGLRMARVGRDLEVKVKEYLQEMTYSGVIYSFIRHEPNSPEDKDGRDFTVVKQINGEIISRSFGVTISLHSWSQSKRLHPTHPQFCFPIGTNKETIVKRILELFS